MLSVKIQTLQINNRGKNASRLLKEITKSYNVTASPHATTLLLTIFIPPLKNVLCLLLLQNKDFNVNIKLSFITLCIDVRFYMFDWLEYLTLQIHFKQGSRLGTVKHDLERK